MEHLEELADRLAVAAAEQVSRGGSGLYFQLAEADGTAVAGLPLLPVRVRLLRVARDDGELVRADLEVLLPGEEAREAAVVLQVAVPGSRPSSQPD